LDPLTLQDSRRFVTGSWINLTHYYIIKLVYRQYFQRLDFLWWQNNNNDHSKPWTM